MIAQATYNSVGFSVIGLVVLIAVVVFVALVVAAILWLINGKNGGAVAALAAVALLAIPAFFLLLAGVWVFMARSSEYQRNDHATLVPPLPEPPRALEAPPLPDVRLEQEGDLRLPRARGRQETLRRTRPGLERVQPELSVEKPGDRASVAPLPRILVTAETPADPPAMPAIWQLSNSDLFTARIYPSLMATATPLASKLSDELRTVRPGGESDELILPTTIQITGVLLAVKHRGGLLKRFSQQLREEFPDAEVLVVDEPTGDEEPVELEEGVVSIALQMGEQDRRPVWDDSIGQERGTHICRAETAQGDILVQCEYIEKPWLENFDAFVSQRPLKRYVVGYSSSLASSEHEARRLAMENAEANSRIHIEPGIFVTASEQNVVDRFAQRLSRPYGDVWREAVLLDVSPDRMAPVIAAVNTHLAARRAGQWSSLYGVTALLGFSALMCVVLNAITQGYYRKRILVGIAVVVMLVIVGGLFLTAVRVTESQPTLTSVILQP